MRRATAERGRPGCGRRHGRGVVFVPSCGQPPAGRARREAGDMDIPRVSPKEPLRTDADLRRWARFISGGLNPLRRTLWVMFLRSEEHTSELQSRFDLVCRLLLEKKKKVRQVTCATNG